MKIATYNVWNEPDHFHMRRLQLLETISALDADVIGLQEVPADFYHDDLTKLAQYPHHVFGQYRGEDEGLAVLSRHPVQEHGFLHETEERSQALHVLLAVEGLRVSFTTLHLPWDSALEKERQICAIDGYLHHRQGQADLFIFKTSFRHVLKTPRHICRSPFANNNISI